MPTDTPAEQQLAQLNQEIEQLEAEAAELAEERSARAREAGSAGRRFRYLRFLRALRAPAASFDLWPMALLMLGPLTVGVLTLIVVNLATDSYPLAFFAFLLGTVAGVGLFATFIYHPADTLLPKAIAEAESARRVASVRLDETTERSAAAKERLGNLLEERRALMASGKVQRAALLQREWKTMPEVEWEDFVVEVCRTLGATVERTRRSTDETANLIAEFGSRRVAVRTKGEGHAVNSSAVQQAIAGREQHHCASCAVIINRRFTGAAQDFAQRSGCALVGIEEFPDFVLGKIEL